MIKKNEIKTERGIMDNKFDYNFDYVTCCGIKALEKRQESCRRKCLFYLEGGIFNSKCKRWDEVRLPFFLISNF